MAGVHPLMGLWAAFIVGLIAALIDGRHGMVSDVAGALAVVMVALVAEHGVKYLFATVVLMGVLQIGTGIFKLGKFIRLVPHPVMLGFVNGLAIVILLKIPLTDAMVMIIITITTVLTDLAVVVGVIVSALACAWDSWAPGTRSSVGRWNGRDGHRARPVRTRCSISCSSGYFRTPKRFGFLFGG